MKEFVFIIIFLMVSCSTDDGLKPGCYQDSNRRIVDRISEATGTVLDLQCNGKTFLIEPGKGEQRGPLGQFEPCNLTKSFQVNGAQVIFSGYVYESFDNEDICADFFEITEIRLRNQ